jgi:hypothetical protein
MRPAGLFFLAIATSAAMQSPPATPSSERVAASFVVRLSAGKSTYYLGEEIPLELEFRGTADKDYYFSNEACGFFGRLFWPERATVTPSTGTEDPLADLFSSGGYGGSCPFSWHALDGTALVIRASLNDVTRFTRPGSYSVVLSSTRLGRYSRAPSPALTSEPVHLTIMPIDDAWANDEVIRAIDLIGRDDAANVRRGAAILRYLGTESAARALVDHFDEIAKVDSGEVSAGLISSPHREEIVQQMEAKLDQGATFDPSFVSTLTRLRVLRDIPPTSSNLAARRDRTSVVEAEYEARWHAALSRRPATAATLSAELMSLGTNPSAELEQQVAHDLEQHPAEAVQAVLEAPSNVETEILQSPVTWSALDRPWILAALRPLYANAHGDVHQNSFPGLGDVVLRRLAEVAPEEGRRLILEEIRSGQHAIRYDVLASLPDVALPELDDALQARYSSASATDPVARDQDRGTTAWLIGRYASADLLPFVRTVLSRPLPGCDVEGGLVVYLLKYDAIAGEERLSPGFDRSGRAVCVAPLTAVAAHYWDDRVESAAVQTLESTDIAQVIGAAQLLGGHGSSAAKRPLLERLKSWSAEWHGRAAELITRGPSQSYLPDAIENNVVNALFENERFALTKEDVVAIRGLCVTDQCRTNVDARARALK